MIHRVRRGRCTVQGLLIAGLIAVILPQAHSQRSGTQSLAPAVNAKDLLEIATRTAIPVSPEFDYETYFWISDKQVFFVRPDPAHRQFRAVMLDAQTGAKTLQTGFNALASPRMPVIQMGELSYEGSKEVIRLYPPPTNDLSPDRNWLLWHEGYPEIHSWWAATLDGSQHHQWKAAQGSSEHGFWLPGGHDWVELIASQGASSRLLIHSSSADARTKAVQLKGIGDAIPIGITKAHTLLMRYLNLRLPEHRSMVEMVEIGFGHQVERAHRFAVRLPRASEVADVLLSPDGGRLAWFLSLPKSEVGEVWLSQANGKQMQRLGTLTGTGAWHRSAHWLPDGKHLSIEDQQVVWTLPIP